MHQKDDVLKALQRHIGQQRGVHADGLVAEMAGHGHVPICTRHLRKLIEDLRLEGHHICAHPTTGYFIAANETELNASCEFLYERAMKSLKQIERMKNVSLPDLRGQLRLPG